MCYAELGRCLVRTQSKYRQNTLTTSGLRQLPTKSFPIHYGNSPYLYVNMVLTASESTQDGTLWHYLKLGRKQLNSSAKTFNYYSLMVYEIFLLVIRITTIHNFSC